MFRFFGQPKFDLDPDHPWPVGYELFVRELVDGQWVLPKDFSQLTDVTIEKLLDEIIQVLPAHTTLISFNLEQDQFIEPKYLDMVKRVAARCSVRLFVELTERLSKGVSEKQLIAAAQRYHEAGILVCIDDVGTGQNTPEMVLKMNPSISEYKFALQNFRPFESLDEIKPELDFWYSLAHRHHKMLAIEGLETKSELDDIRKDYPCDVVQGYLLGKPTLLADQ
ncbi:EAL domain-containing protein [Lacticaseibacillus porcinae]|uniref:EAL domain-containing protein n=1 Tax=Lacticaseibacillus porcinae TaxID=1123687 RepID=UPI000F7859FF|nr:EAL domain-containing protein [Lacticaseibacillus porcinae]